jgi:hypothetical protein
VSFNIIKEKKKGQVVFIQICKEIFKKKQPLSGLPVPGTAELRIFNFTTARHGPKRTNTDFLIEIPSLSV